ncbi:MAG: nuclear transport factor 2 family protein [Acidimicrobiales bacterium]|jgi:hypothetical protein
MHGEANQPGDQRETEGSPTAIVDRYTEELYHQRNLSAIETLVAEPMVRHESDGQRLVLTRAQCAERIAAFHDQFRSMRFHTRQTVDDGVHVASAYEADLVDHEGNVHTMCGLEMFKVVEGMISEVWNPPAGNGSWG